jgi:N-acylneuraminate cytidylyltransferase/CMP-N,N'-diacetyllegionaminic acid synthase
MSEILIIIPARGGSKGIKNKNFKKMLNKPLIYWTIKQTKKINKKSRTIVSTDSKKIKKISLKYNISVPFMRPKNISKDNSTDYELIKHAIDFFKKKNIYFKYILLLQPTSPLRTYRDINQCIKHALKNKIKTLVTFAKVKSEHPNFLFYLNKERLIRFSQKTKSIDTIRQKVEDLYYPEGSIFLSEIKTYLKYKSFYNKHTRPFFLEKWKSIEVDDIEDFKLAEELLRIKNKL